MRSGLWLALLALVALGACQRRDPAEEGGSGRTGEGAHVAPARRDLSGPIGEALRVALGDLDGDGAAEIVVAHADALRVLDGDGRERARVPAPGGVQVLEVVDADGDGRAEILAGWGLTVERRDGTARVSIHRLAGAPGGGERLEEEIVATPETGRHEIVAIRPLQGAAGRGGLLVVHYASKYMVRAVRARRGIAGGWAFDEIATIRMATSWLEGDLDRDGRPELVVGRVYGDDMDAEGDAFLLAADGARTPIPTRRGVRDLALVDLDRDGALELLVADGWHRSYAREGRGRLSWLRPDDEGGGLRAELIDEGAGQYTVWEVVPADLEGDGRQEVVTRGSAVVEVRRRDAAGAWSRQAVAGEARDLAVGDLDGRPGEEILVLGERAEVLSFAGQR